jgi:hypothetical protein
MRVEGGGVLTAATHLVVRAALVRDQAGRCSAVPDGMADPALRDGVGGLADVAADVFELVARDLALLATTVRAGVRIYDQVESGVAGAVPR